MQAQYGKTYSQSIHALVFTSIIFLLYCNIIHCGKLYNIFYQVHCKIKPALKVVACTTIIFKQCIKYQFYFFEAILASTRLSGRPTFQFLFYFILNFDNLISNHEYHTSVPNSGKHSIYLFSYKLLEKFTAKLILLTRQYVGRPDYSVDACLKTTAKFSPRFMLYSIS